MVTDWPFGLRPRTVRTDLALFAGCVDDPRGAADASGADPR